MNKPPRHLAGLTPVGKSISKQSDAVRIASDSFRFSVALRQREGHVHRGATFYVARVLT
jgi:hypothetical protein